MLPDYVLLEIFDFYHDTDEEDMLFFFRSIRQTENGGVDNAGTRVSALEKCRSSITTSPQSATLLYIQNTHEGHPGCLAAFVTPLRLISVSRAFVSSLLTICVPPARLQPLPDISWT